VDLSLRRFHKAFGEVFSQFQTSEQQDVHEFLSCLLLSLNDDMNIAVKFDMPMDARLVNADQSKLNKSDFF
jgi:ubiquitin C-terminal hydrolase